MEASTLACETLFDLSKAAEWLDLEREEAEALPAEDTELAKLEADFEAVEANTEASCDTLEATDEADDDRELASLVAETEAAEAVDWAE